MSLPLCILFKKSVDEGGFPSRWAEANIVPIFKKGSKKLPQNYRSVSLLPIFGKILEKCVYATLLAHVQPVLSQHQHGFVPRRSCDTNLAILLKSAWDSITSGHQTDIIYTDYSAAFQSVNHKLLIYKLRESYNISGPALNWLTSFLSCRKQRVVVNGKCSDWCEVSSGTPEGSQISPLLFALFINDLPDKIRTNSLLFADDVKLYHKITCPDDAKLLQEDLDRLVSWSETWKLNLNPTKCQSFRITLRKHIVPAEYKIRNVTLNHVEKIRDLGVWLDSKLTFSDHVDFIVAKANMMLGLLIRSLQTGRVGGQFQTEPILAAYFGNIRSILEYGCVIWGGAAQCHLDRIERVQHKFLIWLASNIHSSQSSNSLSYHDLLNLFRISSLSQRRLQYDVCFVFKIISGTIDSAFLLGSFPLHVPQRRTRAMRDQTIHVPMARVETVRRGLFSRAVISFNSHVSNYPDADPFSSTLISFKSSVKTHVRNYPF